MTHYQMRKEDRTERVRADKLRERDWIVVPHQGWAWQLFGVTVDNDRVSLKSSRDDVRQDNPREFTVLASTMFVRRRVDRTINMRPDLEAARG